MVSFTVKDYQR